jgi:hypothetical protein
MSTIVNNYRNTLEIDFATSLMAKIFFKERLSIQDSHAFSKVNSDVDFSSLSDTQLTQMGMEISERSLAKEWDSEEDAIWDTI